MKLFVRFVPLLLLASMPVFAQAQHISGTVTDKNTGDPLPGVSIRVKGTSQGTQTDGSGNFSMQLAAAQATLVFSYVGYLPQTRVIDGASGSLSISLQPKANDMNALVVVGYGTVKKRDLTGSVVSIKGDEVVKAPVRNVMESLQGKIPGADVTVSNGSSHPGVNVLLRGHRSLAGGNGPLYIVDGAIYSSNDIDPNDVESIEVLKDASSTAIYGSRGANGVIIITTKSGSVGKPRVSLNAYGGIVKIAEYPHYMTGPEYVDFQREAHRTTGTWNSPADDHLIFNDAELDAIKNNIWTDYRSLLIHQGNQQNYEIGVGGGSDKTQAYISMGYNRIKGLFTFDYSNKYTARLNVDHTINKVLKVGVKSQLTYYDQSTERDPLNLANKINPLGAAFDSTGELILYPLNGSTLNPMADEVIPDNFADKTNSTNVLAIGYVQLDPFKGLSLRSNFSSSITDSREGIFNGRYSISRNGADPLSQYNTSRSLGILWENILTYKKQLGEHDMTFTGVTSYQSNKADQGLEQGIGQLLSSQLYYGLGNATQIAASTVYRQSSLVSFTGRINYAYKGKYLLTLTGREDGSSKLAPGNKWAFFPSAAVGWRVSDEAFMKAVKPISNLKLRFSYGITGNDPLGEYSVQSVLTPITFAYDETSAPAYTFSPQIGNASLEWELSATKDLGIDFGLLNDRISGAVDLYDTHTSGLLLPRSLPTSTGASTVVQNVGKTRNMGIEISLNTVNIQSADFTWSSQLTFTSNRERIVELTTGGQDDVADGWFIGHPVDVIYDYQKIGIWQLDQEAAAAAYGQKPGDIHVKDQNNDNKITAADDRIVLGGGASEPKWSGGLDNSITYKNWDFNIYLFARIGQLIDAEYRQFKIGQQALHNYWTPENPTNDYPRPSSNSNQLYLTTLDYTSGSFAKIRLITLGYTFKKRLGDAAGMSSFRVYASARDPFIFANTRDYDPESAGSSNFPMTRSFILGANINF